MSPEDEVCSSNSRIPTIDDVPLNRGWLPSADQFDRKTNGTNNGTANGTNGTNGIHKKNNDKWSPLLDRTEKHTANNNDWRNIQESPNLNRNNSLKNGWSEIPQTEEVNGVHKSQSGNNNNGSLINESLKGTSHSDNLAEKDPLTGEHDRLADIDEISNCGIGLCKPKWARVFASTHVFMVVFLLAWILQGMYYTYFVSVITTIEKLFQIKSRTTGLLMSVTEIGQISTTLLLTFYAGRGHRPRWIACGMVLFAIASFGCTLPHFIYGDQLLHANTILKGQSSNMVTLSNGSTTDFGNRQNLCLAPDLTKNSTLGKECESDILVEQAAHSQITTVVLIIFFISLLGVGIGQTAVSTLGIPYIDDNVASRESPIYIAITIGVRILGPAGGFILGSFCTRLYVNPSENPGFSTNDPQWVGAWWLGLVLVSSLMFLTSIAMFTFPKNLRGNRIPPPAKMREIEAQKKIEKQEEEYKPRLKDFPKTIKRQLSNDILMFRTASSVLHLLPVAGLYTFLPKYLESQFRLPAHDANLISGIGGILVMGVGIVISGVVILKFNPTARSVAAYIAFTAIVYAFGMGVLMFVGCPMKDFAGLKTYVEPDNPARFAPVCNISSCECDLDKFSPICGADGLTYFSSCHAGCSLSNKTEKGIVQFNDCKCIAENGDYSYPDAVSGYCDEKCQNFLLFICLFSFFVFMHSTSEVGSMLLIMRCTDPKDKAMAMGVIQFAIGLFGNVPCPIIYGAVVDSACLVWETICGKQGACSLYDVDLFRHFFLGTTSGIMCLAFIMDLVVWRKAHRIDIDPESSSSETDFDKPTTVPDTSV